MATLTAPRPTAPITPPVPELVIYHLPVNWLGTNGHSLAPLPTYLQP